jgi:hypothetical protein
MRGFAMVRSYLLALALALAVGVSSFALGGCTLQTASGDPTATEEGKSAETTPNGSAAPAGETSPSSSAAPSSSGAVLYPTRPPVGSSGGTGTESSADAVKAETSTESSNTGSTQDNTQPLPWIRR